MTTAEKALRAIVWFLIGYAVAVVTFLPRILP
jgi:hypothetical protein